MGPFDGIGAASLPLALGHSTCRLREVVESQAPIEARLHKFLLRGRQIVYSGLTVCVVDDDEQVRKLICILLEAAGFTTIQAADGDAGLLAMRQSNAPLVLVDMVMPKRDGLSVISELKRTHPDTKILAMSGGGEPSLTQAAQHGADDTLQKPFRKDDLIGKARRLILA